MADQSPKLIILRGNSGSGKTTIAKKLQKIFGRNTMLLSQDVIRRDMLKVKDGENTEALPLLIELLKYGRRHSAVTILEGILYADWYKPLFEFAVREYGENIYAYYFDLSFEETVKRHRTKPNCMDFGEEDMREWWRKKDFVQFIEEKIITEKESVEDVVNKIQKDVLSGLRK